MTERPARTDAVVYCQGALNTPLGRVAHVLIRRSERYRVRSVIDRRFAGRDAGEVVDGISAGIPVCADVDEALATFGREGAGSAHMLFGVSYEPGSVPGEARAAVIRAIELGLNVTSGLHDTLADDPELAALARDRGVVVTDLRRRLGGACASATRGKLPAIEARRIAVLGTDVGVGKLTTCWALADALSGTGRPVEIVGTSISAWLSGVSNTVIADDLVHRCAPIEIENALWLAWCRSKPRAILVQGNGSLLSPSNPGGLEVIAAARPDCIVLQHAPGRRYYEDAPEYRIHSLERQIEAAELIAGRRVVAIALSGEDLSPENAARARETIEDDTGLPAVDPMRDGVDAIVEGLLPYLQD